MLNTTLAFTVAVALVPAMPAPVFGQPPAAVPPAQTPPKEAKPVNAAVVPAAKDEKRSEGFNARAKQGAEKGDIGVIFMGDSITDAWSGAGKEAWKEFYEKRQAVNFGIGGDRTQHILWRIGHGNLNGLAKPKAGSPPKLVILMIGTNNSNGSDHTAEQIADGIKADVNAIREKLPETKILLLAIFPRGEKPNAQREKNAEASRLAKSCADDTSVFFLDIGEKFLEKDGSLSKEIMPDSLHLSSKGYKIWAEAMEPTVRKLLGEPATDKPADKPAGKP